MSPNNTIAICCNNKIEYFYDAVGTKQKKKVTNGAVITTTDYAGNYIYQNNALQFISQPEGYLEPDEQGGYDYTYQYKDHLGNIRLSYWDSEGDGNVNQSDIKEENNYYPFGLKHSGYNMLVFSTNLALKYKYNGKELQDDLIGSNSLDLYDYGARFYDPAIGRWFVPDPLQQFHSPYVYAGNNPVNMIDPSGMWAYGTKYKNGSDGFNEIIEEFGIGTNSTSISDAVGEDDSKIVKSDDKKNTFPPGVIWVNGGLFFSGNYAEYETTKFLYHTSQELGVEMSAYIVMTETGEVLFFINPWYNNLMDRSYSHAVLVYPKLKNPILEINGKKYMVLAQVHTHTTLGRFAFEGPTIEDRDAATSIKVPIYTIGFTQVSRVNPGTDLYGTYYSLNLERTKYIFLGNTLQIANTQSLLIGYFSIIVNLKAQ